MDFTGFILKGKRKPRTSTSLMTTKRRKIFPNSGPPFVKIIDQVFIPLLQVLLHPSVK
jgi:hypothetical protein